MRGHTFFCVICGRENQVSEHTARCGEVQTAHTLEMISSGWRRSEASHWGRRGEVATAALWPGSIFPPLLGVPTASIRRNVYVPPPHEQKTQFGTLWNLYTAWMLRDGATSHLCYIFPLLLFSVLVYNQFSNGNPIPSFNHLIIHICVIIILVEILIFSYILQIQNTLSSILSSDSNLNIFSGVDRESQAFGV